MGKITLTITLDMTDENMDNIENLTNTLAGRMEYLIGEEFGEPSITHRDDREWAGALYVDEDVNPMVTDITIDTLIH